MEDTRMKHVRRCLLFVLVILAFCAVPVHAGDISVSAAASLREAVTELSAGFSKNNPGTVFQNNFGASGALAKQIESGAPADLFFSANLEWMDYLKERKLVDERSITTFAYNTLVFVGRPQSKAENLQDILKLERIAIGSPKSVPAGDYAMQALKKAGIDKALENKQVIVEDFMGPEEAIKIIKEALELYRQLRRGEVSR
jgi:molybdate transport system substrate-binding protein